MAEKKRRFDVMSHDSTQQYESEQRKKQNTAQNAIVLPEGIGFFKLPKETAFVKIDILPFVTTINGHEQPLPRLSYAVHKCNLDEGFRQFICPREYDGDDCPICSAWQSYRRTMDWNDPDCLANERKLKPQMRQLYAVRWLDAPEEEQDKILIFDTSAFGFGKLLDSKISGRDTSDPDEAKWDQYADLLEGYNLKLTLTEGTFNGNSYVQVSAIDLKPRKVQYDESWYDKVPDLTTLIKRASLSELEHAAFVLDPRNAGKSKPSARPVERGDQSADESGGDASFDPHVIERNDNPDDGTLPW